MQEQSAISAIRAFSPPTRGTIFRKLIRANFKRMTVEDLANAVCFPEAVVEAHLNYFEKAGLVCSGRDGGTVGYAVDYQTTSELWGFLIANCCHDNPDSWGHGRAIASC
jgi:DNA-binding transcriptional ArsR family regulator